MKPPTFIRYCDAVEEWYINPMYRFGRWRKIPKYILHDSKALFSRMWWGFLWLQPFRCNGNAGGWRTQLCEWLENNARAEEEKEYG